MDMSKTVDDDDEARPPIHFCWINTNLKKKMRYYLYVHIVQYLINSCIIMGSQAPNNITRTGNGVVHERGEAIVAAVPTGMVTHEQSIALNSNAAMEKSDAATANEMGKW